jgi:hypothetical protein
MRLYSCFSPSHHELLCSHFLPTAQKEFGQAAFHAQTHDPWTARPNARLHIRRLPQQSPTGEYGTRGFFETCFAKVYYILEILEREKQPFLYADVDVRFYAPVTADLLDFLGRRDADQAFQWDGPAGAECSGFMVIVPSERTRLFWQSVQAEMYLTGKLDQDAMHVITFVEHFMDGDIPAPRNSVLPERYWTFGRNNKHWEPGMPVNPPADLLVHHANWTKGVANKMKLLDVVSTHRAGFRPTDTVLDIGGKRISPLSSDLLDVAMPKESYTPTPTKSVPARHIPTTAEIQGWRDEEAMCRQAAKHNGLPLSLVLQFWEKDKHEALGLAELLADIEPEPRDDVLLVFAAQQGTQITPEDNLRMIRVGRKFRYTRLTAKIDARKTYPGVCYDPWASALAQLCAEFYQGNRSCGSAFFFEADGAPMTKDWIDRLKAAHAETRLHGKRVTGPRMREHDHINGTMILDTSIWLDRPSLHQCPADEAWDIWHGPVLIVEAHPSNIIRNEYGLSYTRDSFVQFGRESAWCTSCKDGTARHWARQLLTKQ